MTDTSSPTRPTTTGGADRPPRPTGPRRSSTSAARRWRRRGPLLPALVFAIVVTQLPFLLTLVMSTLDWNSQKPGDENFLGLGRHDGFVGLDNYATVFTDERLREAVINPVVLTTSVVVVSLLLGLGLAVLLDRRFLGRGLARTLLIAPFLVVPAAGALVWKHALYNADYGLFNGTLNWFYRLFGAESGPTVDYVSSTPMTAVVASLVWQWTPFMMLILLAGLQSQSADVLEAARLDRASGFQTFRFITLPHLRRYLELAILLGTIYVLQTFDAIVTITQAKPNLPFEIYQTAFTKGEYGEASAAGVVVVLGSIIVATFALRVVSSLFKEEHAR